MSYAPTLTMEPDAAPMPRVLISFASFAATTATINVYRQCAGRQLLVRGGVGLPVAGGVGLVDFEAPARLCFYLAEMVDATGASLGFTSASGITPTLDSTWVHNPFNPSGGTAVRVGTATGAQVSAQIPTTTYYPIGRQAGVAVSGTRRGIRSAQLSVYGTTLAQSDALDAMFGNLSGDLGLPPFVCVRFASSITDRIRLPQPLFLAVPAPTQTPVNLISGGTRIGWDLTGDEVDPPAAALAQTLLRRADVNAYYATRAAFNAAYASRLAANTDYNLAGYAG